MGAVAESIDKTDFAKPRINSETCPKFSEVSHHNPFLYKTGLHRQAINLFTTNRYTFKGYVFLKSSVVRSSTILRRTRPNAALLRVTFVLRYKQLTGAAIDPTDKKLSR